MTPTTRTFVTCRVFTRSSKRPANIQQTSSKRPANVQLHYNIWQQTSSKRPALARVFWIHLLEVCWTFAGSCKHPHQIRTQTKWTRLCHHCVNLLCQVHPTLLSVVLDKQESEQVRASAFMVLKKSHPSFTTLQLIGQSLRKEQSRQIKTLIYTSLVNLAKTKSDINEVRCTYVCCIQWVMRWQ